jgi:hypothetical protein
MNEHPITNHIQDVAPIRVHSNEAIFKDNIWFIKNYSCTVSLIGVIGFEYTITLDSSSSSRSGVFDSSNVSIPFTFISAGVYKYTIQYSFRSKTIDTFPFVIVIDTQTTPDAPIVSIYKIYRNGTITLHIQGTPAKYYTITLSGNTVDTSGQLTTDGYSPVSLKRLVSGNYTASIRLINAWNTASSPVSISWSIINNTLTESNPPIQRSYYPTTSELISFRKLHSKSTYDDRS